MTYVVDGSLWHKDSKGNAEELGRGAIQFMSAGTGVSHSEANHGGKPLRFVQSWIVPRKRGLTPSYGSASGFDRVDKWAYMVGDAGAAGETPKCRSIKICTCSRPNSRRPSARVRCARGAPGYVLVLEATSRSTRRSSPARRGQGRSRSTSPRRRGRARAALRDGLSSDGRADSALP